MYHHHHNDSQAQGGLVLMLIGAAIGSPFLFYYGLFQYTTASVAFTAASVGGVAVLSLGTLGIGALILYGSIGLAYLVSSAMDSYKTGQIDIKSRIINEEGLSVKGVINSIGAILWSPFILLGGAAGMLTKTIVNAVSSKTEKPEVVELNDLHIPSKMSSLSNDTSKGVITPKAEEEPVHHKIFKSEINANSEKPQVNARPTSCGF